MLTRFLLNWYTFPMPDKLTTSLITKAREAFSKYEYATQEDVDFICARVAWACCEPSFVEEVSSLTYETIGLGDPEAKPLKMGKVRAIYDQMKGVRTCGVIERDVEPGVVKFAKPVGVIAALIPVTNPELTPAIKALWALKTRNAVVLAPHPRALTINNLVAERIRSVLSRFGYPEDLVLTVEKPSIQASQSLMEQCDLVLATGGAPMVRAAYSSGTPSFGVGVGNAYMIVDDTVDLALTAEKIRRSKTFDFASGCSSDNGALIQNDIYDGMIEALQKEGGFLIRNNSPKKASLASMMWSEPGKLNPEVIARPATTIAKLAGLQVPEQTRFLMVEEDGVGPDHPFSREKLSPVLTLYRWKDFEEAVDRVNEITGYNGSGHSCGIHSFNDERIQRLAEKARVSRVTVRQPHGLANSGAWTNGLKQTCTLGCGTWGGSIVSENVNFEHLLNVTRLSYEIERTPPTDEELFGREVMDSLK